MMNKIKYLLTITLLLSFARLYAQKVEFIELADANMKTFSFNGSRFEGPGWVQLINEVKSNSNILIGEDHLTNEIPQLVKELSKIKKFDNFYIEVDPHSAQIIENSIKKLSVENKEKFNEKYKHLFSFYSLQPEYELLEYLSLSGTKILGADQILMYADRLIFSNLITTSENKEVIKMYQSIIDSSKVYLENFLSNPQNPMYFMTPGFSKKIDSLETMALNKHDREVIKDVRASLEIYISGSHQKRVQLLKHLIMKQYDNWKDKNNLFKYGAIHMSKGESFLGGYDIGNLIQNLVESNYDKSYHIMIIGKSGEQGAPFKIFPPSKINPEKGLLKSFKPFFSIPSTDNYYCLFDLNAIRKYLEKEEQLIKDKNLLKAIHGYDALIVIPKFTAAKF